METKRVIWLAVVVMLAVGINASATIVTFDMSYIFEWNADLSGPTPWVTAVFDDGGTPGDVDLTISANLVGAEKVGEVYFNLDEAFDPTALGFVRSDTNTGFEVDSVNKGENAYKADGDGYYDIKIDFNTDDAMAFDNTDSVTFTIDGIAALTADSFNILSYPGPGSNTGPFLTAAHMQGLGPDGQKSSWITVPEPATMILLGLGSILLRKRK